jgi:hypothetical protein
VALVALWAGFAAAAVGVGFGAAGLVGDPFTVGTTGSSGAAQRPAGATAPASPATSSPTATGSTSAVPSPTGQAVTRTLSTRAGLVSAVCQDGLVRLNASPAVGWGISDLDSDRRREARVRFERTDEDEDGRVEVRATCAAGNPAFALAEDDEHSGDEDGGGED